MGGSRRNGLGGGVKNSIKIIFLPHTLVSLENQGNKSQKTPWKTQAAWSIRKPMIPGKTKGTGNSNGIPPGKSNGGEKIDSKPLVGFELRQLAKRFSSYLRRIL